MLIMAYFRYFISHYDCNYIGLFKIVSANFMAIYVFYQLLKFRFISLKPIAKFSRRHFRNLFDVLEVLVNCLYYAILSIKENLT